MVTSNSQVTSAVWSGNDNGDLVQWDVKTGKKLKMSSDHGKTITDMQTSKDDGSMLITSSKDCNSMLFNADKLSPTKKYVTEQLVSSASLSPIFDHVVLLVEDRSEQNMNIFDIHVLL